MNPKIIKYGEKTKFESHKVIQFPDFMLEFLEEESHLAKKFPGITFRTWYFVAKHDGIEEKISWGIGFGLICPVQFTLDGKEYSLNLSKSDKSDTFDELTVSEIKSK